MRRLGVPPPCAYAQRLGGDPPKKLSPLTRVGLTGLIGGSCVRAGWVIPPYPPVLSPALCVCVCPRARLRRRVFAHPFHAG